MIKENKNKNSILELDENTVLTSPIKDSTNNLNSSICTKIKDVLNGRDSTMTNLTIQEIVDASEKLVQKRKFISAINICNKALVLYKFESVKNILKYQIAICYLMENETQKAAGFFFDLMSTDQIQVPFSSLFYNVSKILDKEEDNLNKRNNILALYKCLKRRIQNSNGQDIESRLKLAKLCEDLNSNQDAIEEYQQVLKFNPKEILIMYNLSILYKKEKDYFNLGFTYLNIAKNFKEEIKPNEIYNEDDESSNINKCIMYFFKAQKLLPNNIEVLLGLSEIHRIIDRHKEALGFIEHALKINDKDYRIYYEGFLAYEEIGDFHTAKELIRICLVLNVAFVKGFNAFGNLMRKEKMFDFAIELFEIALMREPENVLVLNNYGTCFLEMGDKFKAKDIYLQAYHLDHNLFEINCNLSNIYRREYNYDKAVEHILKAKDIQPDNPQVLNILSSIYMMAGLIELAISSCRKSLSLDQDNCTTLLQLAIGLKLTRKYSECVVICLNLLRSNPKYSEAFFTYAECMQYTNQWNDIGDNITNINAIAEYHNHVNNQSTYLNSFIADYLIQNSKFKFWVHEVNCLQDLQNVKFAFDELPNYEIENANRMFSPFITLKIAYLIEDIREEHTLKLITKIILKHNKTNQQFYFIIFESDREENNFNWHNKIDFEIKNQIIDLTDEENPKTKAEYLFKLQFDVIIYLEYLSNNPYNNLLIRKIYQTLAIRPVKIQIILTYNGCTRDGRIFDYTITDQIILQEKNLNLYKEKLIICKGSPLFCWNPYEEEEIEIDPVTGLSELLDDPFSYLKAQGLKLIANFSDSFKIDNEIFSVWCEILQNVKKSCLLLKYCNEESSNNLKALAEIRQINPQRIIFITFKNNNLFKYSTAEYIKYIDLYLDVQTVNGDFEIFFCMLFSKPYITINTDSYPITSSLSESVCSHLINNNNNKKNYSQNFIFRNLSDYMSHAINFMLSFEKGLKEKQNLNLKTKCNFRNYQSVDKFISFMESALNQIKRDYIINKISNIYVEQI